MEHKSVLSLLTEPGHRAGNPETLEMYGPLIGSWRVESTWYGADGKSHAAIGEWHFTRILGGLGVQDVLFAAGATPDRYGTTLRCYDPGLDAWRVTWAQPAVGEFASLVGRHVGDRVVQEGSGPEPGRLLRWSFTEIRPDSFVWLGEFSDDGGATWFLEQQMRATRFGPGVVDVVPASDDHYEFSYQVKKDAEGELIAAVFGWDEAVQREYHLREWGERRPSLITLDGTAAGTVEIREESGCLYIRQFFIAPALQNRGIGAEVLRRALRRADEAGLPARLALVAGNRCVSLYRRHGFEVTGASGALCYMERRGGI